MRLEQLLPQVWVGDGHRTGDLVLPEEDRPITGCQAMGDLVLAALS